MSTDRLQRRTLLARATGSGVLWVAGLLCVTLPGCQGNKEERDRDREPDGGGGNVTDLGAVDLGGADGAVDPAVASLLSIVLGRPTASSVALHVLAEAGATLSCEYGETSGSYTAQAPPLTSGQGEPVVFELAGLKPDTRYFYRIRYQAPGGAGELVDHEQSFRTRRAPGATFSFGVQGDSHPERVGKMFHPELYRINLANAAARRPDFYVLLGDDFSIEALLEKNQLSEDAVDAVYLNQRRFLGALGSSTALFLVNGNHEQAAGYLLTEAYPTPFADAPIFAGRSRLRHFPLPAPDGFYSGDPQEVPGIGLLRDYYAWEWGDALFVTLDPYWHSPVPVDTGVPGVEKEKDDWLITMGDEQYAWLERTLEQSSARFKFVFEHHVLGNGRGGAGLVHFTEWGGYDKKGKTREFEARRPGWARPVHQLLVDTGVTIFFYGHDHLYAREEVDGVVYQSVPNPADDTYTAFNSDAFDPGSILLPGAAYDAGQGVVLPNSGYLHVTVSPAAVRVDYVRAFLPEDEGSGHSNGEVAFGYTLGEGPPTR